MIWVALYLAAGFALLRIFLVGAKADNGMADNGTDGCDD